MIPELVSDIFFSMFDRVEMNFDWRSIAICNRRDCISPVSLKESRSCFTLARAFAAALCERLADFRREA